MVVAGGGVDVVGGIAGAGLVHVVRHRRRHMCRRRRRFRRVVGVQLRLCVLAMMEGAPSRQVGLGVVWRGVGGVRQVGTSIFHA